MRYPSSLYFLNTLGTDGLSDLCREDLLSPFALARLTSLLPNPVPVQACVAALAAAGGLLLRLLAILPESLRSLPDRRVRNIPFFSGLGVRLDFRVASGLGARLAEGAEKVDVLVGFGLLFVFTSLELLCLEVKLGRFEGIGLGGKVGGGVGLGILA